jgi:antitoxin (DNA-binding transcriptional repressor) of toxin-antitoxin stability system
MESAMSKTEPINIYEAKTHFSKLCDQAASGSDVVVARHGQPWVRITALQPPKKKVRFGVLKGTINIADDFDAALPLVVQSAFEGS